MSVSKTHGSAVHPLLRQLPPLDMDVISPRRASGRIDTEMAFACETEPVQPHQGRLSFSPTTCGQDVFILFIQQEEAMHQLRSNYLQSHRKPGWAAIRCGLPQEGLPLTAPVDSARRQEPTSLDRVLPPRARARLSCRTPPDHRKPLWTPCLCPWDRRVRPCRLPL